MSLISQYSQKEQLMKQLQEELQNLEQNENLKKELEFKEQLEMLMKEYEKTSQEVIQIIAPERFSSEEPKKKATTRKPRKLKVYKNPMTGEVVETRGGNQRQLKMWKEEHGDEVVEGWLINDDADNQPTPDVAPPVDDNKEETTPEEQEKGEQEEAKQDEGKKGKKQEEKEA